MVQKSTFLCFLIFIICAIAAYFTLSMLLVTIALLAIGIMTAIFAVDAFMDSRFLEGIMHILLTVLFLTYGFFGEYLIHLI